MNFEGHKDFVGSAIGFRRDIWDTFGPWPEFSEAYAEDIEFKTKIANAGFHLALPLDDLAENIGFGETKSTVVNPDFSVRPIVTLPRLF